MSVMSTAADEAKETGAVAGLPWGRPLTYADLETLPDDGHRYELIDGVLIVSPSPRMLHQRAVGNIYLELRRACPSEWEVFLAPFDVVLAPDTVLEPDLLVARRADLTERNLPAVPVLAIEVLSPFTRRIDLLLKRDRLQSAGCSHYWVVEPSEREPSIRAWRLVDGVYREHAGAAGNSVFCVEEPYSIQLVPADLIA